jgi:hypothetical protein
MERKMYTKTCYLALTSFTVIFALSAVMIGSAQPSQAQDVAVARYTDDGRVMRPNNWRSWVYVGTPLTPNALNGGQASFPEFHNVYVETSAYLVFAKTGEWPEGTQIAKELVLVRESDSCDEETGACGEVSGVGYFQGEFNGLELTVKDTKRFADEPGGWAYFSFGHNAPPYAETATAFATDSCNSCHENNADTDFVFTQFYPVLRAANPNK